MRLVQTHKPRKLTIKTISSITTSTITQATSIIGIIILTTGIATLGMVAITMILTSIRSTARTMEVGMTRGEIHGVILTTGQAGQVPSAIIGEAAIIMVGV